MDGNETSEEPLEIYININGQPYTKPKDHSQQEITEKTSKQHVEQPVSPNSLNSEIHLHTLPNVQVHILQQTPQGSDNDDVSTSSNLDNQDISCSTCTSAVLVTDAISISSTSLSAISQAVVFTTPVLSTICPSSESISGIDDDENSTNLIITKSEPSELMISKPESSQDVNDSSIAHTPPSTGEISQNVSTTTTAEGITVTAHQTSLCYLRQIFDHDQLTSQGQMPTLAHGVASHSLPELHQCKWQGCCQHFLSLEDLVQHVNEYHIRSDKHSEFCCYWQGCARNGKGFNARYKMLIHMRTHTGEKPHKCHHENCGKSFSRLENLKIHQRSHTGERPYVCPIDGCDKRYSNSSDRFKHTRTHYERKPYHCRIEGCEKCYTDPSSLRKHLKTHHGQDVNIEEQE